MAYDAHREWPFRARDAELATVLAAVRAGDGDRDRPSGTVVVGAAGVGKTRLVAEAADRAVADGIPVHRVKCTASARSVPYAALAHLTEELAPARHDDAAALFRAVTAAVASGPRRPVLVVDDGQLLDDNSAALLLHLTLHAAVTPLITVRRGVPVADAVTALWKDGLTERVDLGPLSPAELEEVIASGIGGHVAAATAYRLARRCGGNVLYARELVRAAVEAGALTCTDGLWSWDGTVVLGDRVADAVGHRLAGLDEAERAALLRIVIGEPLPLRLARRVAAADVLARLEERGLIRVGDDGCRIEHPLFGDVLQARSGTLARHTALRALAAAAGEDEHESDHDLLRRVSWLLECDAATDAGELARAARIAYDAFDVPRAQALAEAALQRAGRPVTPAEAEPEVVADAVVTARIVLGSALNGRNRFAEAEAQLAAVERRALAHPDPALRRMWLDARIVAVHQGLGRAADAEKVLRRAEDAVGARLAQAMRANLLVDEGRLREAVTLTGRLLTDDTPDYAAVLAASARGEALASLGLTASARRAQQRLFALRDAGAPGSRRAGEYAMLQEAMCRFTEGRADEAAELADGMYRALVAGHETTTVGLGAMVLGHARLLQGKVADARRALREAVDSLRRSELDGALPWALSSLAQTEALLGDAEAARAALDEALAMHRVPVPARSRFDLVMAQVRVAAAEGDLTRAGRLAVNAASGGAGESVRIGSLEAFPVHQARLAHLAARLGENPRPLLRPLARFAADAEGDLVALLAAHVRALADHDGPALVAVARRFAERGMRLVAIEAEAAAAAELRAVGSRGEAERADARRARLLAECGELPGLGPGPASTVSVPCLSRREREVAALAAGGLTNPQIAERLTLSVRTVESHLYRVFGKLGVRCREELAAAIGADAAES